MSRRPMRPRGWIRGGLKTFQRIVPGRLPGRLREFRGFARRPTARVIHPVVVGGFTRRAGFYGRFGTGGELKFHDIDIDDAAIASNGNIAEDSCNAIAQGVTEVTRVGRKCTIRSINWRFTIQGTIQVNTATPANDTVRVILYLDKQCNGATATVTDILESDDIHSFNNLANKGRFRTLMDRTYSVAVIVATGSDATAEWKGGIVDDTFFKKVNIPIEFDSTTGAITEIRSNNIGLLLLSVAGTSSFASKMRLRYSDI